MCSTVFRRREQVHYCSQENQTGVLLFSGEGMWCSTVSGERNWCITVLKEKETGA